MAERTFEDYQYVAEQISNISRIPVRIYREHELETFMNTTDFPVDPATPYLVAFLSATQDVSYYVTEIGHFYGILHQDSYTFILGPCYQVAPTRAQIRTYMHELGIRENYLQYFNELLSTIVPMPLEMFLHMICLVSFYLTGTRLSIAGLTKLDTTSDAHKKLPEGNPSGTVKNDKLSDTDTARLDLHNPHNTYRFEQTMLSMITDGDLAGLEQLFANETAGQAGKIAGTYLRQIKNTFVASTTLVSRAAIAGGLSVEEAFTLSDRYILSAEKYDNPEQILHLQVNMVLDYASLVNNLRAGRHLDSFTRKIISYVREHITEPLTVQELSDALGYAPSTLSKRFKTEMNQTLSDYIRLQKLEKARDMLTRSDLTITEISNHLGYSSQAHFQNLFKAAYGMTPKKYREA